MKAILEGLLFVSGDDGLTIDEIKSITDKGTDEIKETIKQLYSDYEKESRGIQIEYLGNHYKLTTKSKHKEYYKKMVDNQIDSSLSQSALEVLAIIAYNQPITRLDVDEIRGVNSAYVIRKLLIMGLIEEAGKSDAPGRPKLYSITSKFLDHFGLGSIDELPIIEKPNTYDNDEKNLFESKYKEMD